MFTQLFDFGKECETGDTWISINNPLLKFIPYSNYDIILQLYCAAS